MLIWGETMRSKQKAKDVEWAAASTVPLDRIHVSGEDTRRSAFLRFCAGLNLLTSLAMILVIGTNMYFSLFPCNKFIAWRLDLLSAALSDLPTVVVRLFSVLFALLVVFAEIGENSSIMRNFSFLQSWVFRGLFLVFIGSLQLLTRIPCELMLHFRINQTCGSAAVSLGCVYLLLGLLCFRQLRTRTIDQIRKLKQAQLQAQILVEQRAEIDHLLSETSKRLLS